MSARAGGSASGESVAAAEYYRLLLEQTATGNSNRDGLREDHEYIADLR